MLLSPTIEYPQSRQASSDARVAGPRCSIANTSGAHATIATPKPAIDIDSTKSSLSSHRMTSEATLAAITTAAATLHLDDEVGISELYPTQAFLDQPTIGGQLIDRDGSTGFDGGGMILRLDTTDCDDICPTLFNADQSDIDSDGLGDACEGGAALADVDLSGRVDGFDLARLAHAFGSPGAGTTYDPAVDLDRDGDVDGDDLALLAASFSLPSGLDD